MNRRTIRTNMTRKCFAMFLIASLVISLFAVGFTASADTGAVSPSDVVTSGIVTVETEYKVVAPSAGDTDSPQTGDSNNIVIIDSNIMFICAAGMYLVWRTLRKKENA
ncbi:MAG: hypothetical protein J6L81_01835 [Clostridia bacterium]|nr:hypothetical protein [Clostridia bacterium]